MGVEANVQAGDTPGGGVMLTVSAGEQDAVVIGHRGETLQSLQHIVTRIINRESKEDRVSITIDVAGYQERREQELVDLAEDLASKVRSTSRDEITELLPASERRIVHRAI